MFKIAKGRGVFANEFIPKKTFVCEYKTTQVYRSHRQKQRLEEEYKINKEPCKVVEVHLDDGVVYFDGTRRTNQFGAYINHSRMAPNIKLFYPPIAIRGKLRIAFISIKDISIGEELLWDYKDKDIDWFTERKSH